jgi:Zn-dependent alcohol dehydrogenase
MTRFSVVRIGLAAVLAASSAACSITTAVSQAEVPEVLVTELSASSVLARAPMQDTARVAGSVVGMVGVIGLLNQTAPCFALSAAAQRAGSSVVVRITATEQPGTCATFAAGAFDYDVAVRGLAAGAYDVDVMHRVQFKDGRVTEAKVGARRVEVR